MCSKKVLPNLGLNYSSINKGGKTRCTCTSSFRRAPDRPVAFRSARYTRGTRGPSIGLIWVAAGEEDEGQSTLAGVL